MNTSHRIHYSTFLFVSMYNKYYKKSIFFYLKYLYKYEYIILLYLINYSILIGIYLYYVSDYQIT